MCRHFKADFSPALIDGEILIRAELCKSKKIISDEETKSYLKKIQESQTIESLNKVIKEVSSYELSPEQKEKIEDEVKRKRDRVNYFITSFKNAPHPENAQKFLEFIKSNRAQKIYKKYGFIPHFFRKLPD